MDRVYIKSKHHMECEKGRKVYPSSSVNINTDTEEEFISYSYKKRVTHLS